MKRLYSAEQFGKLEQKERDAEGVTVTTASIGEPEFVDDSRVVRYVFSTPEVGRDMHTVAADAWELENYRANPVFLWAHDDSQPPIGRVIDIGNVNGVLRGSVEYAERELNPFADMIFRLVRGKYLNAVSTSWAPLEWTFSRDKSRPGGIDFRKVDMLEISQVPIPALPDALATARSNGIDTGPLFAWAEKLLDTGGQILIPRTELETLRRAAKMPAAKKRSLLHLNRADPAIKDQIRVELKAQHTRAISRAPKVPLFKRGLYDVAQLAYALSSLGYCHSAAEYEAAVEEDNSEVPAMLGEALTKLGEALIAMTNEEVAELLAEINGEGDDDIERSLSQEDRAYVSAASTPQARAWRRGIAVARAGKSLSASNQKKLEEADGHQERAAKHHRTMADHNESVSGHLSAATDTHQRMTETLSELGVHVRAAQEATDPKSHLEEAARCYRAVEKDAEAVADSHGKAGEAHEDAGDAHHSTGRSLKRAQRCIRSVVNGSSPSDDDDDSGDDDKARAATARASKPGEGGGAAGAATEADAATKAREARATRARELADKYREPIVLDLGEN